MILAAGYLLFMHRRIVFGDVSDFLAGLGDHLTDMTPVEVLTLAPLVALAVVFGIFPASSSTSSRAPCRHAVLVAPAASIAIPADGRRRRCSGLIAVGVVGRIGVRPAVRRRPRTGSKPTAGPPIELAGPDRHRPVGRRRS